VSKATKASRPVGADAGDAATRGATARLDLGAILTSCCEAAYDWRLDTDTLTWTSNATELLGLTDEASIATGSAYDGLLDDDNVTTRFDAVMRSQESDRGKGVAYQVKYAIRRRPRARKQWVEDTGRWFAGPDGKPQRAEGIIRIVNDRHKREQHLRHLSRVDPLTGEINRWHLTRQLDEVLKETLESKKSCGFLLVAVDNLGQINRAYGYDIADEVIGVVASRLRSRIRECDCLGRFSGNKFGVILRDCSPADISVAADRLLEHIRRDVVRTSAGPIAVTVTIGGVVAPWLAGDVHNVLTRAQETLDLAKQKNPGSFLLYQPSVEREAMRRQNILATDRIVSALNERRIMLAYEPVVDARTRDCVFYECLLRIEAQNGAIITASEIMPVAERLGLVRLLDQRVLELVIAEMVADPGLRASVNVSATSTLDVDWWARLEALLHVHDNVAERLIVEITETTAIHDLDHARAFVARVKDLGARIAIDDFGAGFTSFRNLRKLGVDMIKIDGAFVQNLQRSADDRTFVRTMLDLAQGLRLKSVAEWVPNEETAAILADWGCDYLQGGYVGQAKLDRRAAFRQRPVAEMRLRR